MKMQLTNNANNFLCCCCSGNILHFSRLNSIMYVNGSLSLFHRIAISNLEH